MSRDANTFTTPLAPDEACEVADDGVVRIGPRAAGVSLVPAAYGGELDPTEGTFGLAAADLEGIA